MAAAGEAAAPQGEQQEAIQLGSLSIEQLDMMRKQLDGVSRLLLDMFCSCQQ